MVQRIALSFIVLLLLLTAFSLPAAAVAEGVDTAQEQQRALLEVNRYRKMVGMPPTTAASGLTSAAAGHAKYTVEAAEFGHYETRTTSPYYIGYSARDRAARYGYSNSSVTENIYGSSYGASGARTYLQVDNAIQWWMGAIYHRFPIVSPRTEHIGYGPYYKSGRGVSVLDFGNDYALTGAMTRYPVVNQTGVGVKLDGEFPNPVAQFGGSFPTGYPVSITWYRGAVKYTSMKMVRKDGLDVPGYKLSPENDEPEPGLTFHKWSTSLSFIPKAPLALGTRYTVTIAGVYAANGNLATGSAFTYTWSFTTMPGPPAAPTTTPAANAVAVSRTANLVLQYNQPLRAYTMVPTTTASGINVGGVGASLRNEATGQEAAISIVPPTTETSRFVTITPGAPLAPNTTYRLSYRFADAWGRLTSGSVRFTTAKT